MAEAAKSTKSAKKKRPKVSADEAIASQKAEGRGRFLRGAFIAVAGAYFLTIWLDAVGSSAPSKLLPRPWLYFSQVAALFTTASSKSIDYRAEGWSCAERKWVEMDVRPYFPLDADNKENRFQRALQFYRKNRTVMRALDEFIVRRYNESGSHAQIGGVRFLSLRIPFPAPGEHVADYAWKPLASYPADIRHDWYWTPKSRRAARCGYPYVPTPPDASGPPMPAPAKDDDQDDRDTPKENPTAKELEP